MKTKMIDIVFDGPPGPEAGRFVEVEDVYGNSLSVNAERIAPWIQRVDGYWVLRLEAVVQETTDPPNFSLYGHRNVEDTPSAKWNEKLGHLNESA